MRIDSQLDLMILVIVSNVNDSMVLLMIKFGMATWQAVVFCFLVL